MGKFRKIVLSVMSFMLIISNTKAAACDYEEKAQLNKEAANVKANYEIKERIMDPSEYTIPDAILGTEEEDTYVAKTDYMQINILNITKNMYVEVTNDKDSETKTYTYNDVKDGNISFDWYNIGDLIKYTIKVYASNETGCSGNTLKTLYVSLPRYNDYSTYNICTKVPEYYMCQKYVTYEDDGYSSFVTKVKKEVEKQEQKDREEQERKSKWYNKMFDFIKEHKTAFIVGGVTLVVVAGGATYIIIKKRRRSII